MSWRLILWLGGLVVGSSLLAEWLLGPSTMDERWQLLAVLAAPAVVAAALVPVLRRWVSSRASVAGAALVVGLCSLALGAVTSSAASNAMFLSDHDYRLFLLVLILSCGIALLVGSQLTQPLARDIAALGEVAQRVADGDFSARSGIKRNDEVGRTADAVDRMIGSLQAAADERERLMAARQLLFTGIGHDLRTPLAAMRAAIESLQDGVATDPDRYLTIVAGELDNVQALLVRLIDFARIESGQDVSVTETVSVAEVAHEAVEALRPLADRRGVTLCIAVSDPCEITASALDISRAVRNLIDNAIRHSPADGTVVVSVSHESTTADGESVHLSVRDQGAGFPADFRVHAFEPFTRADSARSAHNGHSGLGLAIARALVQQHGGRAWLGDEPGGDVRLSFPPRKLDPK